MIHVTPTNDTITHTATQQCTCDPTVDGGVVIHNAADGRQ
jgi:hypothetical protein